MPATVVGETGSSVVGAWLVACVSDSSWTANITTSSAVGWTTAAGLPQGSHRPARGRVAHSIEALSRSRRGRPFVDPPLLRTSKPGSGTLSVLPLNDGG